MHISASMAKNEFGRLLDTAQSEPVTIQKKGRPVAVVISIKEYHKLEEIEERLWAKMAEEAENEGVLSESETEKFLKEIRNAKA